MSNKKTSKKNIFSGISGQFLKLSYFPMIILTLIITIAGSSFVLSSLKAKSKSSMADVSNLVLMNLDDMYEGSFEYKETNSEIYLFKGEHQLNGDFEYIDNVKTRTGFDITICYMNYAVITTLRDNNNNRLIGAGDSDVIVKDVIEGGSETFYSDVKFNKKDYMAYYKPLRNSAGEVIGMICVASSTDEINSLVWKAIIPLIGIAILAILVFAYFTYRYSKDFIDVIYKIRDYMKKISEGDFRADIDFKVEKRKDELGMMGRSAQKTAGNLRVLVEEDQLTSLNNRRSADKKIKGTLDNYYNKGVDFCLAIGDIDFFKKVNDTYGHEAGDKVLIAVSSVLKNFMADKGYAIRWGGEEFILVFDKGRASLDSCSLKMNEMLDEIRAIEVESGDQIIKVTMTFGLLECEKKEVPTEDIDKFYKDEMDYYIAKADGRLYYGKEHGRNQLVNYEIEEI